MSHSGPKRPFYDSILVQTLIALSFNIISLFAGGLIAIFTPRFQASPWILALFPPILTIRGGIGGIFSGNLATMLHLGLIRPQIRDNTSIYKQLVGSVFVITLVDTIVMGVFAFALNAALGQASFTEAFYFVLIPPVACVMAMALSLPMTSVIAIATFRKGLDPDILVYPVLASINDIIVTLAFVATVSMALSGGVYTSLLIGLFVFIMGLTVLLTWTNRKVKFFYQTIREGITIVILSSIFGSLNGYFLSGMSESLQRYPGLVVLYPALTNALGNIGSIIGSTTTTSIALGYVRNLWGEIRGAFKRIIQVEAIAFVMHVVFGLVTYAIVRLSYQEANLLFLVGTALVSNLSSFLIIGVFALVVANLAFRRGLNPDNVVIPAITSVSDTIATIALTPALLVLKLLGIA